MAGGGCRREHRAMDWTWYLFGFKGRINRAKYWLAGLVIVAFTILFASLAVGVGLVAKGGEISFGYDFEDIFNLLDPTNWRALTPAKLPALLVQAAGTVLFFWIFLATSIKRLHDRNKSAWWMMPFFAVPALYKHFAEQLPDSYWVLPLALIAFVLCLWGFVELYALRGTKWTNQYGPDPLGKEQMRARSARARLRATTAWDQESEIEMVPHTASPPPLWRVKPGA
jgi:uncharacterized membrane protein YhaH (DUF805 family)